MTLELTRDVLRRMPLFRTLDDRRLQVIAMTGEIMSFLPGERIFEKGDEGDAAFVILEGAVDVLMPNGQGGETCLSTLGPGEIVGELAALTGNPRATSLTACGKLTLLRLDRESVLALLREYPEISLEIIRILADRLQAMNAKLA